MARTYKRDNRGRFASGGTSSSGAKAKAVKPPTRGRNRITRDNAGRITSVGGQGATARGGRLKTAAGNKRGAVVAKMSLRRGGVVGKPKGLKPGALAERRGRKAKPVRLPKSAAQAVAQANRLLDKLKMQKMENPGGVGSYRIRDRIDQVNQAIKKIIPGYRHNPTRKGGAAKAAFAEQNRRYGRNARALNNIGRLYG